MARVTSRGVERTESFLVGSIHPVHPTKEAIKRDPGTGLISLTIFDGDIAIHEDPHTQNYWSLYEPGGGIRTFVRKLLEPDKFVMIRSGPSPSPPLLGATLIAQRSPRTDPISDIRAVLWADKSILWCVNARNESVCYVFVDNPDIKPTVWPRSNSIAGEGYRRVQVASSLFHTNDTIAYVRNGGKAESLHDHVRFNDGGQHKRRTFWCNLSKDAGTGKYRAELVVLELPVEPLCPTLTAVESASELFRPFAPKRQMCHNTGAHLSYVEQHDRFKDPQ